MSNSTSSSRVIGMHTAQELDTFLLKAFNAINKKKMEGERERGRQTYNKEKDKV